jgi:isoleucyl-tRNA synthetase
MSFKKVNPKADFTKIEHEIIGFWNKNKILSKYLSRNKDSKEKFSFLDGPITANNPMGVHHAWGRTLKDLWQRYETMKGKRQRYQNGFDCQGLWVEVEVEKELGFKTKKDIEAYGINKFVEKCKERVKKYSLIQTEQSKRLGFFMDWDNSYYTMSDENNYMIWYFLKKCFDKGYLYKGHDVVPWCSRCGTAISQHEILTEDYQELVHKSVYLKLPLKNSKNEYFLVWTTTPWTLTSNTALAVNPDLEYAKIKVGDEYYYLSEGTISIIESEYDLVEKVLGKKLAGLEYTGPFDDLEVQKGVIHRVITWADVGEDEGTGIVHIAPGCGEEDFQLGKEFDLAVIAPLDEAGDFVQGFGQYAGKNAQEVAKPIFKELDSKGILFRTHEYTHRYPTCWRCKEELIFRLVDEWYIGMDIKDPEDKKKRTLRQQMIEVNEEIKWIPLFGKERELDWLNNMHDWLISKKRYWGLALPIYECQCGHFEVVGSKEELKGKAVKGWDRFNGHTPHRPWVDEVKIKCPKCSKEISRVPDVGNPWLDAGIVPFSTYVDPKTKKLSYTTDRKYWSEWYPAEFITESFPGQFKNWFYSLIAMSTVLERTKPFQIVLGYALVKDEIGEEMHKSKGNTVWFDDAAEEIGVDVMRWLYIRQNPFNNLLFGYKSAGEIRRKILTLWNVYSFFITYARIDNWRPQRELFKDVDKRSMLDRWIISDLQSLVDYETKELDRFRSHFLMEKVEQFIDSLSTWYVRRSRRRFWKSEDDSDKNYAYQTLYEILLTLSQILAPVIPYITEEIYQNLTKGGKDRTESVHLTDWPKADKKLIDKELINSMRSVRDIVSFGLSARAKQGVKVRQPLNEIMVLSKNKLSGEMMELIKDEVNVKSVKVVETREKIFNSKYELGNDTKKENLQRASLLAAVDLSVSRELREEGIARETVRKIQDMRKKADFEVSDRIEIYFETKDTELKKIILETGHSYLKKETLAVKVKLGKNKDLDYNEEALIEGKQIWVGLKRIK